MQRTAAVAAAALPLLLPFAGLAEARAARAVLKNARGEKVGMALLVAERGKVNLSLRVHDLPPGKHGLHLHAVGKCEGPDFQSAGPHWNPTGRTHGAKSPGGHHLGDLPNLEVGADGKGALRAVLADVRLGEGPNSLFGPEGTAVVVHEKADDETTDPSGNSGSRIACGPVAHGGE